MLKALGLAAALTLSGSPALAGELTLEFPQLRPGGQVSFAVFPSGPHWKRRADPIWAETRSGEGRSIRFSRRLPPGEYAVMAYHDLNSNGRLDTLPVGLPTEPYGFSNNSRGVFGPPAWGSAKFRLTEAGAHQAIRLR